MAVALTQTQPPRRFDSERERLRRRRNRHARLAADGAVAELALGLRVRDRSGRPSVREAQPLAARVILPGG